MNEYYNTKNWKVLKWNNEIRTEVVENNKIAIKNVFIIFLKNDQLPSQRHQEQQGRRPCLYCCP